MPTPNKPTILHPLSGADPITYTRQWLRNFPLNLRSTHIRLIAVLAIAVRSPRTIVEHLKLRRGIAAQKLESGPIFVIGHWRSGTTHLHNLLSQDPRFGRMSFIEAALPWGCNGKLKIARWFIRKAMPKTRGMDDLPVTPDTPQEEEIALGNMNVLSFFNTFYFPRKLMTHYREAVLFEGISQRKIDKFASIYRYLVRKFSHLNGGKLMIFKNPANTGRVAFLKEQFPNAKFIHIVRNPYEVYASTEKLWQFLFNALSMQDFKGIETHLSTLEIYETMMKKFLTELPGIPDDDFIELRFEDLERDPVAELAKVYEKFSLSDSEPALDKIRTYADTLRDYRRGYYQLPAATLKEIEARWGFALKHWNYKVPEPIDPTASNSTPGPQLGAQ